MVGLWVEASKITKITKTKTQDVWNTASPQLTSYPHTDVLESCFYTSLELYTLFMGNKMTKNRKFGKIVSWGDAYD